MQVTLIPGITTQQLLDANPIIGTGGSISTRSNLDGFTFTGDGTGADLSGLVAQNGAKFSGVTLIDAILDGANISGEGSEPPIFDGGDLTNAKLRRVSIKSAQFLGTTLAGTDFAGTPFDGVTIANANARGINFEGDGVAIPNATLTDSFFYNVDFSFGQFQGVIFDDLNSGTIPDGIIPAGTPVDSTTGRPLDYQIQFRSADLRGVSASGAILPGTDFRSLDDPTTTAIETTQLDGASFEFADLTGADFTGLDLTGVSFKGTDLTGANFTNAILQDVDLTEAILTDAIVTGADFSDGPDADLFGADLSKANVTGSGLTRAGLIADNATIVDTIGLL